MGLGTIKYGSRYRRLDVIEHAYNIDTSLDNSGHFDFVFFDVASHSTLRVFWHEKFPTFVGVLLVV